MMNTPCYYIDIMLTVSTANKQKLLLVVIAAFLSMIFLDQTGVGVTLPSMQSDLHMTNVGVTWVMNAFLLTLSILLLFCGRLSDHLGYRKMFITGMVIFLIASILCATAYTGWWIIAARALQGVGGSLALSTYLILLGQSIPQHKRGKALGLCAAFGSLFLSGGPLIGGFFSQVLNWRWIFWINLPIALVCIYFTYLAVAKDPPHDKKEPFDVKGLLFFTLALTSLVIGLMEGPIYGWDNPIIILLFILFGVSFIIFCALELNSRFPLLQLRIFKNKNFLAGNIVLFCTQASALGMVFWALWLQKSHGFSPLITGFALLPAGIPYILTSRLGGGLLDKYGPKLPIVIGTALFFLGNLWIALFVHSNNYFYLFWGMVIFGCGWGFIIPCSILTVMASVKKDQQGMGSGVLNTMRQVGGSLGLAIIGAVITSYDNMKIWHLIQSQWQYKGLTIQQINQLLFNSTERLAHLDITQTKKLAQAARHFYTHAFFLGMVTSAIITLISLICAIFLIVRRQKSKAAPIKTSIMG